MDEDPEAFRSLESSDFKVEIRGQKRAREVVEVASSIDFSMIFHVFSWFFNGFCMIFMVNLTSTAPKGFRRGG